MLAPGGLTLSQPAVIKNLVAEFTARKPMRTTSLIITLFGDVVSQHGGSIWLGSLVRALASLSVNERLVRTSVFRLVQEGWLESERVGRRSYYRFTDYGTHEYERAAGRIYALENSPWSGRWQLLIPLDLREDLRSRLRRSLHWQGFRMISAGTFAKLGTGGRRALGETLAEFDATDRVLLLEADTLPQTSPRMLRQLVQDCWHLDEVALRYRDFLKRFKPLSKALLRGKTPDEEAAFIARTLLIHDYRRVLLQDTRLPKKLLPRVWPGAAAEQLTGQVYRALAGPSVAFICAELEGNKGLLGSPERSFSRRFAAK